MTIHHLQLTPIVLKALEEESRHREWATDICVPADVNATAEIVCEEDTMLAGTEIIHTVFANVNASLKINTLYENGEQVPAGTVLANISGQAQSLLKAERVALALLAHCCGIASTVAACVAQLTDCQLLASRNIGGTDMLLLEREAAAIGGVCSHRLGLSDSIVVSAKQAKLASGIKHAVSLLRESISPTQKIAVEIRQLEQLQEACEVDVDLVLLHTLDLSEVAFAVRTLRNQTLTAVTGDIPTAMIADYADTGVNFISSDTLIRTAKRAKIALNLTA